MTVTEDVIEVPPPLGLDLPTVNAVELAKPVPPPVYPVKRFAMAPGPPTLFLAYSYGGKTIVLQDLLLAKAAGLHVWGEFPCDAGAVLHVDYEQGLGETRDRYQRLARGRGLDLAELGDALRLSPLPSIHLNTPGAVD